MKKVLGIDPGFGRVGWAVLEGDKKKQKAVASGCYETDSDKKLTDRISMIYQFVLHLIEEYEPDEAAVEELYYFKNAKTVMGVGQARGAIIVALKNKEVGVFDYTPLQIKSSIAGYGKADKKQVQEMVKRLLKLKKAPKPDDAADACAVALTHFFFDERLMDK